MCPLSLEPFKTSLGLREVQSCFTNIRLSVLPAMWVVKALSAPSSSPCVCVCMCVCLFFWLIWMSSWDPGARPPVLQHKIIERPCDLAIPLLVIYQKWFQMFNKGLYKNVRYSTKNDQRENLRSQYFCYLKHCRWQDVMR